MLERSLPERGWRSGGGPEPDAEKPLLLRSAWRAATLILLISWPLFFLGLGSWPLLDPDEGRYAEISREMLERHDPVTPTLDYVKYFEKPPLLYWCTAASFGLFGISEWAGRSITALAALAGLFAVWALGRRMFGERAGILAAVILGTTLMWPVMARVLVTDMLFAVLMFCAIALWWVAHTAEGSDRRAWFAGFWASLGLAVLAKGPIAIVLTAGAIVLYGLLCRDTKSLSRMEWTLGVSFFLAITAPWFVLVALRNPAFNHFFWYEQHVERFLGTGGSPEHEKGLAYFLVNLPIVLLPWSAFIPGVVVYGARRLWPPRTPRRRAIVFLAGSAAVTTIFFSISSSKLLTYILPVLPFTALVLAAYFDSLQSSGPETRRAALISGVVILVLAQIVVIGAAVWLLTRWPDESRQLGRPLGGLVLGLEIAWIVTLIHVARRGRPLPIVTAVSAGFIAIFTSLIAVAARVAPSVATKPLLDHVGPGLAAGGRLVLFDRNVQSAVFYARRRLVYGASPGELTFGKQQLSPEERELWFPAGIDGLRQQLSSSFPVYCLVGSHEEAQRLLRSLGGDVVEIVWNRRRSIVGNAPAAALTPPRPP